MTLNWWGKLLGGTFGFMMAGPAGALLGTVFGHNFDKNVAKLWGLDWESDEQERTQETFLDATFLVMGHLAKLDGRVSENEIAIAQAVIDHLGLTAAQRQAAIQRFQEGKQPGFTLEPVLAELHHQCHQRFRLIQQFVEIQLNIAYADGAPLASKRAVLVSICERLGFPRWQFEAMDAVMQSRYRRYSAGQNKWDTGAERGGASVRSLSLADAYATLGLNPAASNEAVKMAYRRLINRFHPDKLTTTQALSKEVMERANEKTRQIKMAYEHIKRARGMAK